MNSKTFIEYKTGVLIQHRPSEEWYTILEQKSQGLKWKEIWTKTKALIKTMTVEAFRLVWTC